MGKSTKGSSIIVVGSNRGGTSAVASSLHSLGVFLGDSWHEPIYEDIYLAKYYRSKNWRAFKEKINEYECQNNIFAWKLPDSSSRLGKVNSIFSKPRYIFVFRDLFAISDRMHRSLGTSHLKGMTKACLQYLKIIFFIKKTRPDCLLVSYEKMLFNKEEYAISLLDFIGMDKSKVNIEKIKSSISPSPNNYTNWAENAKLSKNLTSSGFIGYLDHLDQHKVSGWVRSTSNEKPVYVDIFVNETKIHSFLANIHRQDLVDALVSDSGNCGFSILFKTPLQVGDVVSAVPSDTKINLIGSPRTVK